MILSKKNFGSIIFLLYICIIENIIKKTNMDCRDLKRGDIIRIKGIFGIDCIGIFNKIEDETIYLYCAHYADMNNICCVKDGKYYSINIDSINACLLATEYEIIEFYNKIGKYFTEEYDKDWYNHFTDSSYFDVQDFLLDMFCIKVEEYDNDMIYPDFVDEIHHYIWEKLCEALGYKNYGGDEFVEELVNKQEFIDKACKVLRQTDTIHYIENGRFLMEKFVEDFRKAMEE